MGKRQLVAEADTGSKNGRSAAGEEDVPKPWDCVGHRGNPEDSAEDASINDRLDRNEMCNFRPETPQQCVKVEDSSRFGEGVDALPAERQAVEGGAPDVADLSTRRDVHLVPGVRCPRSEEAEMGLEEGCVIGDV